MRYLEELQWKLEEKKREVAMTAVVIVVAVTLGFFLWWWLFQKWQPPPSIFDSPVEDVLGYLSMDDFSKLPLEERIAFLVEFSDRFRGMDQADSAAMAAFLAGLSGPVRQQATDNARELAKDILVEGASTYVDLPESERAAYLDEWLAQWMRMGERVATGDEREMSDEDRLSRMRGRAQEDVREERDTDRMRDLNTASAVRFMDFWSSEVETTASPREQGQIVMFMRDLRKHLTDG